MANTKITNPELFNLGDSTSATQLPVMTTTERIAMTGLSVGEMIFNSTTDKVEYFDGTKWYGITYDIPPTVQYLVVAGGGGTGTGTFSGGAGAGGYLESTTIVEKNTPIPVTVGLGGTGATAGNTYSNVGVSNGQNSIFNTVTAVGGGFGSTYVKNSGSGGSGGGEAAQYTHQIGTGIPGQGNDGGLGPGNTTGGGGGARNVGGNGNSSHGGDGGSGNNSLILTPAMANSSGAGQVINSASVWFSGGGAGSRGYSSVPGIGGDGGGGGIASNGFPINGMPNTGGGGGGGGLQAATTGGASGGSGVVILRYSINFTILTVGLTSTTFRDGVEDVTIITAGTGTVEFT